MGKEWFLVDEFGGIVPIAKAKSKKDAENKVGIGTKYDKNFWHVENLGVESISYKNSAGLKGVTKVKKHTRKITSKKIEHSNYRDAMKLNMNPVFGRWHYIYSSSKGKISLIKCINHYLDNRNFWEIYSLKGNLFDDIERFKTKTAAVKRIKTLLC